MRSTIETSHSPRPDGVNAWSGDAFGLERALARTVRGEVRFTDGDRALYATDGSNYRQVPIGVVVPRDANDVVQAVAIARQFHAPVLGRGCGTSLAGQCCNVGLVIDMSKYMNRIVRLDASAARAVIEPGIILDSLRDAAEQHDLTFAPDPSTHSHCTLGGMIGNNSCGVHSVMGGKTDDNVESLEILTYDGLRMRVGKTSDAELASLAAQPGRRGEIYAKLRDLRDRYADRIRSGFPDIPRRVSGYNLPMLLPEHGFDVAKALVGSESTCVIVLEATTRLVHSPPARSLLVLGYPDVYSAADHVPTILEHHPIGLEGIDDYLVEDMTKKGLHPEDVQLLPDGRGWLLVEFGCDTKGEADDRARELMDALRRDSSPPSMKLFDDPPVEAMIWKVRESGLGATARVPGEKDTWEGWEDSAVAPENLGAYLRDLRALFERYDYACSLYGHFGQGCVHTRIDFDLATAAGIAKYRAFMEEAADLVLSHGGSLSGEHGDGQSRAELLPKMFGPELMRAFGEFKAIWDPDGKMNPGKIVDPYRIDENLRIGAHYNPPVPPTYFNYPDDDGSFARATARCVGVGDCRRLDGGVMCPSFMATREEKHSTRGRAHLLFEMLEGNPLRDGWRDDAVHEALDLCLACKGCKHDCPVNVDMATYKAEFLSHYFAGRLRPRTAYSMG
ncbi:MAG TPA: FAD-binding and (Fe-S)-binding domain-containing protein, partial [Dehalococcoidia bacterium]|nr:FAD-binding and (Fe-S)-binding domain-containing protein [Dehalococcoidia bacterium]